MNGVSNSKSPYRGSMIVVWIVCCPSDSAPGGRNAPKATPNASARNSPGDLCESLDSGALRRERNTVEDEPDVHGGQVVEQPRVAAVEGRVVEDAQPNHMPALLAVLDVVVTRIDASAHQWWFPLALPGRPPTTWARARIADPAGEERLEYAVARRLASPHQETPHRKACLPAPMSTVPSTTAMMCRIPVVAMYR